MKKNKKKIINSFVNRDIVETTTSLPSDNLRDCIKSIQIIDEVIKTQKKTLLLYYGQCGEILQKLKELDRKRFRILLEANGVKYSLDYINFIIDLSKMLSKHHELLKCSLSIYYIKKNMKLIKEIYDKNKW